MQLRCSNCDEMLEVPDAAAGKKVRCPACLTVTVAPHPDQPQLPAAARSPAGARSTVHCPNCDRGLALTDDVAGQIVTCPECRQRMRMPRDLPPAASAPGSSAQAAPGGPPPANLYPPANPYTVADPYTAAGPHARSANAPGPSHQTLIGATSLPLAQHSEPIVYILPGVMLAGVAGLTVLITSAQLLWVILNAGNLPAPRIVMTMLFSGVPCLINLVIATAGIQMARQRWLTFCRVGAILALIPLFGFCYCGNTPFGIWAAVVLFSANASRDFR